MTVYLDSEGERECDGLRDAVSSALRRLRREREAPLKVVAAELGVSVAAVNAWEIGTRFPAIENLVKLARWYGVQPCKLLNMHCANELSPAPAKSGIAAHPACEEAS